MMRTTCFCILTFIFLSCTKDQSPINVGEYRSVAITEDYSSISDPQQRWDAYKIKDYVISERIGCFCAFGDTRFRTVVRDEMIYRVLNDRTGEMITNYPSLIYTINQLFDFVDSINPDSVAIFEVEYDSRLGYPKRVFVDPYTWIADDEISFRTEFLSKIIFINIR